MITCDNVYVNNCDNNNDDDINVDVMIDIGNDCAISVVNNNEYKYIIINMINVVINTVIKNILVIDIKI